MSENGFVSKPSKFTVSQTLDRFEAIAREKGLTIFARIDHAEGATNAGLTLRPTQLLIFGSPKGGTPVMVASPSAAIDLPLKVVSWQDDSGQVWLGYNTPDYLVQRHGIPEDLKKNLAAIVGLVDAALA